MNEILVGSLRQFQTAMYQVILKTFPDRLLFTSASFDFVPAKN